MNHFVYYVDQDWNLPIGYVYLKPDDVRGMKLPGFNSAFWVRGEAVEFQPHLFYKDKEVGKITLDGAPVSVTYAGPAPGFPGLDQINVQLPSGTVSGQLVVFAGKRASNAVTLPPAR